MNEYLETNAHLRAELFEAKQELDEWRNSERQYPPAIEDVRELSRQVLSLNWQLDKVQKQVELYERALLAAFPEGASGEVFDLWNEARNKELGKCSLATK